MTAKRLVVAMMLVLAGGGLAGPVIAASGTLPIPRAKPVPPSSVPPTNVPLPAEKPVSEPEPPGDAAVPAPDLATSPSRAPRVGRGEPAWINRSGSETPPDPLPEGFSGPDAVPLPDAKPATPPAQQAVPVPEAKPTPPRAVAAPRPAMPAGQVRPRYDPAKFAACINNLKALGVVYDEMAPIRDEAPCGMARPLKLEALSGGIAVSGEPVLNCAMVLALSRWVEEAVKPATDEMLGGSLARLDMSTSYQCRRRNGASEGKYSEHAFGNGIDIMGFRTTDGREWPVMLHDDKEAPAGAFQATIRKAACKYFTTVLGPGTNEAHAVHFHLDLAIRKGGYRLCE